RIDLRGKGAQSAKEAAMKPVPLLLFFLYFTSSCLAQENDPFAGDERLQKKHTIQAAGIPLKELLGALTTETGIRFAAGPRVAEDKVVLVAHDRQLVASLRMIARFFNFYWSRSGEPGAYSYTLSQSLKQQKLEEQEIEAAYIRATQVILGQAKQMEELSRLSP